jgi:hypothetical protein
VHRGSRRKGQMKKEAAKKEKSRGNGKKRDEEINFVD